MEKKGIVTHLKAVNEYERESKLKGLKSLVGVYAGEHTSRIKFEIVPLFVAHGAPAFDLVVGGNLMAVLSWAFLTAQIAVKHEGCTIFNLKNMGYLTHKSYNLVQGVMFCFLTGSIISLQTKWDYVLLVHNRSVHWPLFRMDYYLGIKIYYEPIFGNRSILSRFTWMVCGS